MGRVAVLLALLVVAGIAVRGRIPEVHGGPREQAADSPASLAGVVTLLAASVLIMAIALVSRLRNPVPTLPSGRTELPGPGAGPRARLGRRLLILAAGLAVAWLMALVVANLLDTGPAEVTLPPAPAPPQTADEAGAAPAPAAETLPPQPDSRVLFYLEVTTVILVVMTLLGTVLTAVRQRRGRTRPEPRFGPGDSSPPAPGPEPLAVAARRGLAEVGDLSRGPREAIIACYVAMEQALADSPGAAPRDSDTPSEVLARAVGNRALSAGNATTLVDLFAEARFSPHLMSEDHREVAERALRAVLDELRQPV